MAEDTALLTGKEAEPLLAQAQQLRQISHRLRDYPHMVAPILRDVVESLLCMSFALHDAGRALREEAATAIAMARDPAQAQSQASYASAMVISAGGQAAHARSALMSAESEISSLLWPEHDPVAAETVKEHHRLFDARAESITPDTAEPASEPASAPYDRAADRHDL